MFAEQVLRSNAIDTQLNLPFCGNKFKTKQFKQFDPIINYHDSFVERPIDAFLLPKRHFSFQSEPSSRLYISKVKHCLFSSDQKMRQIARANANDSNAFNRAIDV
jgi:hypothetical protein